jgi:hypothetical protein
LIILSAAIDKDTFAALRSSLEILRSLHPGETVVRPLPICMEIGTALELRGKNNLFEFLLLAHAETLAGIIEALAVSRKAGPGCPGPAAGRTRQTAPLRAE